MANSGQSFLYTKLMDSARNQTSKPSRRERFANIALENTAIANSLMDEVRKLLKKGDKKEADRILDIVEKLLVNNNNYQSMVGEVLQNVD
jgi:site-specific recombinase